jgi:hypothetical protein
MSKCCTRSGIWRSLASLRGQQPARPEGALGREGDPVPTRAAHFVPRIWELRDDPTAYDAAYVALAEALDAPLVKTDGRLTRAPGHHARVELYS